jgi:hypothetical protein
MTKKLKVLLYRDATLVLPVKAIADGLTRILSSIDIAAGEELVEIGGHLIRAQSYRNLPPSFLSEACSATIAIVATVKRYENNYFYDTNDSSLVIISFSDWELLTNLPLSNGLVFFVGELLAEAIGFGRSHSGSRCCLNDFRQMKTDIDFAIRAAFVCQQCLQDFEKNQPTAVDRRLAEEIGVLLDNLSHASRANSDIVKYWKSKLAEPSDDGFDVFLCHNSSDKDEIRKIATRLKEERLRPWLDEEQLRPGARWQRALQEQLSKIRTAAVFVGANGVGPWQDIEIEAFLVELVQRGCPVIPVILHSAPKFPDLPPFLRQLTWVDFRTSRPDPWMRLLWGVTGTRPNA